MTNIKSIVIKLENKKYSKLDQHSKFIVENSIPPKVCELILRPIDTSETKGFAQFTFYSLLKILLLHIVLFLKS